MSKKEKKVMSKKKKIIWNVVNLILVCVLLFSGYKIYEKMTAYKKDKDTYTKIQEIAHNDNTDSTPKLQDLNPDYKLWIKGDNTNIDYPVVQAKDNDFYLRRDYNKKDSISGTPFLDYRVNLDTSKNTIIYAHYMRNNTMFGQVKDFKEAKKFKSDKIRITRDNKEYVYQPFSIYTVSSSYQYLDTDFKDDKAYNEYLDKAIKKSAVKPDISVTAVDKILTLSTCSYDLKDGRTVLHAKLIQVNDLKK